MYLPSDPSGHRNLSKEICESKLPATILLACNSTFASPESKSTSQDQVERIKARTLANSNNIWIILAELFSFGHLYFGYLLFLKDWLAKNFLACVCVSNIWKVQMQFYPIYQIYLGTTSFPFIFNRSEIWRK